MKKVKFLITGFFLLTTLGLDVANARASEICNPNNLDTHYKVLYCGIRLNDNEAAEDDIIKSLASQFSMDKELIKEILAGTVCKTIADYSEADIAKLPKSVRSACMPSGLSTGEALASWTVFTDIRNAYEKEIAVRKSAKSLKFKFKASEQYWDGTVSLTSGPPFDLIVDLNLIEIVLFGSKAQWMQDVYSFPKEEEEEGAGETPTGGAPPSEEEGEEAPAVPETPEEGLTVTPEGGAEEEAVPPDCVPPSDPNADTGDGPSSNFANPLCGNGTVDILMAEECDDSNLQSGDGCNQYCRLEAGGASDMCVDPQAVTFKQPTAATSSNVEGLVGTATGTGAGECPPGTVPTKGAGAAITGPEGELPPTVAQSPEYPGPYVGGTLKQYPESNPPICPPGQSSLQISYPTTVEDKDTGETKIVSETSYECIPTEFCADFSAAQDFLFGEGWEDNEQLVNIAPAIEALFCVNIKKENRPKSPYKMIEGCVDCNITAMADALEKALQTNVSPLVNTTSAFGISSKYGPAFSFNLNTAVKRALRYQYSNTAQNAIKEANRAAAEAVRKNTPPKPAVTATGNPMAELAKAAEQADTSMSSIREDAQFFGFSSTGVSDQETGGRLIPLLEQLRDRFISIEQKYEAMVGSLKLDEKEQCKP